jgi:hypothetical protein
MSKADKKRTFGLAYYRSGSTGVKIYNGDTVSMNPILDNNINIYGRNSSNSLLTDLVPSTIQAQFAVSNIPYTEEQLIKKLGMPKSKFICAVVCNYGEIFPPNAIKNMRPPFPEDTKDSRYKFLMNVTPPYTEKDKVIICTQKKRGRKKKEKKKSKRKPQGSGKYFNSQLTIAVYHPEYKEIYLIKLFRENKITKYNPVQVPGGRTPTMRDIVDVVSIAVRYLRDELKLDIKLLDGGISVMRNYLCRLRPLSYKIMLYELEDVLLRDKLNHHDDRWNNIVDILGVGNKCNQLIKSYFTSSNTIKTAEITYNPERFSGLVVKFRRPVFKKSGKCTTIKIMKSGKINFDGGNSEKEITELYYWLRKLLTDNKSEVLYDIDKEVSPAETSSDSGESLYDSE